MEAAPIKPAVSQPALRTFSWVGTLGGTTRGRDLAAALFTAVTVGLAVFALLEFYDLGHTEVGLAAQSRSLELDPQVDRLHVQLQQMVRDKEIFRTSGVIPPRLGSGSRQT